MKQIQSGDIFDKRYRLEKRIGGGGYSEVWLAQDIKADHKVALKIYAPGQGLDEDGVQIFTHEFKLAYNFNHTNLLHSSHFEVYENMPYLVMPYYRNGSANDLAGRITEEQAWRFLHDVAAGLEYLHSQDPPVIHQDVKPQNVLIDDHGTFLITDFGISTKAQSTLRRSVGNASGSTGGTVAYMAPERWSKDRTPVKASDVWALGATLFELITGDVPFFEKLGGQMQRSGAEIPEIKGAWSAEMKTIVERCLALETWDRPMAQQLVEWTERHKRGERIFDKSKPSKPSKPPKPPRPEPKRENEGKSKSKLLKYVLFSVLFVVGLTLFFKFSQIRREQQEFNRFQEYKEAAVKNFGNATKEGYVNALDYCNRALAIKNDAELENIKEKIFQEYKKAAVKNFDNAKKGILDYSNALDYCNRALAIKNDTELENMKRIGEYEMKK
jgi:serine/threonine protein kinase